MNPKASVPRVLVLMATYNGSPWIEEQIESIFAQQGVEIRLVIADDASNDGTAQLLLSQWNKDPRVQVTLRTNGSGSAGANFRQLFRSTALENADYVALADQDDVWLPTKLNHAIKTLEETGAAGYSSAVESFWEDGRKQLQVQSSRVTKADFLFEGAGQGCTFVLKRALFEKMQQFFIANSSQTEALHYHDWLIYLLARAWNLGWYFDSKAFVRYRQHAGNEIGSRGSYESTWKRLRLIKNGWYRQQIEAAIVLHQTAYPVWQESNNTRALFYRPRTAANTLRTMMFCLSNGRRRYSDRVMLILAIMAGWI